MTTTTNHRAAPQPTAEQPRTGQADQPRTGRRIGSLGTAARLAVGIVLLGLTIATQAHRGFDPVPWIVGLVGLPAVLLAAQWLRSRRFPDTIRATGPVGHAVNLAAIAALSVPAKYVPSLHALGTGVLIFYTTSMVLAAVRGYAGCEVLAISNWLLRRDDQVGCVFFLPVDEFERRRHNV